MIRGMDPNTPLRKTRTLILETKESILSKKLYLGLNKILEE